jgi:hypothetical protein
VFAITVVGAVIRAVGFNDSLFGDELSTYAAVMLSNGPGDIIHLIRADESLLDTGKYVIELTPPLYFLLAWAAGQLGDVAETIRLPALIAGILTIPLVYAVGLRTVGRNAALFATGLAALSPYMIYESNDARAYGLATFLVLLTALALLKALEDPRPRWWLAYGAATTSVIYTHYTAAVVLAGMAAWALLYHRKDYKPLILANVAAAIAFLPWLGEFLDDRASPYNVIAALSPFTYDTTVAALKEWVVGAPSISRDAVPGGVAEALILAGVIIALLGCVWRFSTMPASDRRLRIPPGPALAGVLAFSTPIGLAVYSALGTDILVGRYFIISSPGLMLVAGMLLAGPRMPLRAVAATLAIAGFAIGAIRTVSHYGARPDYKGVADFLEDHTQPSTPVLARNIFNVREGPLTRALAINLPDRKITYPLNMTQAAERVRGSSLALVMIDPANQLIGPHGPAAEPIPDDFRLEGSEVFPGSYDLGVYVFDQR